MDDKYADIPAYVNMSTMAKLLNLSRSRLYQLIDAGVLLQPVYLLSNKLPAYTKEMAVCNLEVKRNGLGVNKQVVMFHSPRSSSLSPKKDITTPVEKQQPVTPSKYLELIDALESLGLENITAAKIDAAIQQCFPDGTENISDDDILTTIFRHLKC